MFNNDQKQQHSSGLSRRHFLAGSVVATMGAVTGLAKMREQNSKKEALISITYDLEMSRHYPKRDMMEWDFQKGNLDAPTKAYSLKAAEIASEKGGLIHYFCVGRVLEQKNIDWIKSIAKLGHPIGNHTYDHINVLATTPAALQFRFKRAPWLIRDKKISDVIYKNIETTSIAMRDRAGIEPDGFRTPGGFSNGLADRPDIQKMFLDLGFDWVSAKYPSHKRGVPKEEPTPDVYESIVAAQKQAQPFIYPSGLIEIPMSPISDVTAFRSTYWKLEYFLKAVRLAVEWAIETGGVYDFLCHPSCMVVEDPNFETVKLICDLVNDAGDKARIVGLSDIAKRTRERQRKS